MSDASRHTRTLKTRRTDALRAAAVLTAAGAAVMALTGCTAAQAESAATALQLPSGGGPAAACAELTPDYLSGVQRAFSGEVVSTDGDRVVLDVTDTYAGDVGERVTLPQQSGDLPSEMSIGVLEVGQTYLIAADGDAVLTCGASGPATPELQAVYDAAF